MPRRVAARQNRRRGLARAKRLYDFLALLLSYSSAPALISGPELNALRARSLLVHDGIYRHLGSVFRSSVSGTSSALPRVRMTARSMKFSNSRIFPGHSQAVSPFITAEVPIQFVSASVLRTSARNNNE